MRVLTRGNRALGFGYSMSDPRLKEPFAILETLVKEEQMTVHQIVHGVTAPGQGAQAQMGEVYVRGCLHAPGAFLTYSASIKQPKHATSTYV